MSIRELRWYIFYLHHELPFTFHVFTVSYGPTFSVYYITLQCEAIPESLKNMLLVMHTAGILSASSDESQRWKLTWDRIDTFLPNLKGEVFKPHQIGRQNQFMLRNLNFYQKLFLTINGSFWVFYSIYRQYLVQFGLRLCIWDQLLITLRRFQLHQIIYYSWIIHLSLCTDN